MFYSISAVQNREVVTVNVGDTVIIDHAVPTGDMTGSILDGYTLTVHPKSIAALSPTPLQESYDFLPGQPVMSGSGLPMSLS